MARRPLAAPSSHSKQDLAAPPDVNKAMIRRYLETGYLVVEGLLTQTEIAALKREPLAFARGTYFCPGLRPAGPDIDDRAAVEPILCIHQPHYASPVLLAFVHHARVVDALRRLVGAHLPYWEEAVKCVQTMLFVKPPGYPGQAWHQDECHIPTRDRSLCAAWIAVDEATTDNGCLWVIPGSHRMGYLYPQRRPTGDEFDGARESYGFTDEKAVPVEVAAGSVVFFSGYLLHRSLRNRSAAPRRALVAHYMNAWSLLPWLVDAELREHAHAVATADNRRVVHVAGVDPYAWKGYETPADGVYLR